ncbi:hypothetical protein CVIRNUC_010169 [Coccomyxa viridis]|uniref:Uncharacterized protein n=1 Tax=Coccomyxa viridis TaxID=1274662 RepID=A0AAV1IKH1_9CHLO|nr:hypothetical protein CVIRNUC_010169 [Coccomyxa viridis]
MTEASNDKVQAKYAQQYRDLKQILLAKHFSGQGVQKKVVIDDLEVRLTDGPPLKRFVTPPRLSEDLAKYLNDK